MTIQRTLLVPFVLLISAAPAQAATYVLTGNLSGANEIPTVPSPGTGTAVVTLDDVANTLSLNISFSGLLSPTVASHIHCCAPLGTNAGVATTTPTFAGFPLGVTSGTYLNTLDLTQASSYNPAFVTANGGSVTTARQALIAGMIAGQSYLNIHTSQFPGGEIRSQLFITAVPEPASWAMMIAGFGAIALMQRRRRVAVPA